MLLFSVSMTIQTQQWKNTDVQHLHSFIETRILSKAVVEKLHAGNVPFAQVEDAAAAVMHIASDPHINGKSWARLRLGQLR
jgi:hypothetical protein